MALLLPSMEWQCVAAFADPDAIVVVAIAVVRLADGVAVGESIGGGVGVACKIKIKR